MAGPFARWQEAKQCKSTTHDVNGTTYTYEPNSKDDCMNGGWQNFTSAPGPFKNQGQCVSFFASGKGN